jgi:hypothetical protein
MSATARLGLVVLTLAVLLGLLADWLLRPTPVGLGATLWTLVLLGCAAAIAAASGRLRGIVFLALALAPLYALCLSWRDSPILAELNVVALLTCLVLTALPRGSFLRTHVDELGHAALLWIGSLVTGLFPVVAHDVDWEEVAHPHRRRHAAALGRGVALAIPVLIVFGVLFVTADAVFGSALGSAVPRVHRPVAHLVTVVVWAWIAGGLLRGIAVPTAEGPARGRSGGAKLGAVEAAVVLGLVDLLFLAFVAVQFRAFVGGRGYVVSHAHLTYADYARSGFFQLVAVAALALVLLLALDLTVRRDESGGRTFRVLGWLLVVLVLGVLVSAAHRMQLYERTFGLTGLRFYTLAFMGWLAVVLAWLCWTVLRGKRERFVAGVIVSGLAAVLVLNAINPDAIIARVDMHLVRHQRPVDYSYLGTLSDDAVPTILAGIPELQHGTPEGGTGNFGPAGPQYYSAGSVKRLIGLRGHCGATDWRTWNRARQRARELLCKKG